MTFIRGRLAGYGFEGVLLDWLSNAILIAFVTLICVAANFITKKVIIRFLTHMLKKSKLKSDQFLLERKVLHRASHFVPAIIIYTAAPAFPGYEGMIEKGAAAYFIVVALTVINRLLSVFNDLYQTFEIAKTKPIKGYVQVAKLVVIIVGIVLLIANLMGKSPLILLSGIGALSAVFMLVFKDSLLGLVAGIQLSANDMVRMGDWIEMPKYGADGDVIDISLNTVMVRNFDRTVTMIPSYALISDSFKNWRGMQESGGRRIKRALYIDTSSISFCTEEMIARFKKIHLLKEYIEGRQIEIGAFNSKLNADLEHPANRRALTNIGVFRAYISEYLKQHPGIHQEMTLMVRQLAPEDTGLPLEIYAFANSTDWTYYETVQSDIFDHLFAVAGEFGLRIFQNPAGSDFSRRAEQSVREKEMV